MDKDEVLALAQEAGLGKFDRDGFWASNFAVEAYLMRFAALLAAKHQKPVAWVCWNDGQSKSTEGFLTHYEPLAYSQREPLYRAPVAPHLNCQEGKSK